VARGLSRALDAPLVLQRYSRLVIDCNRPFDAPDCIPATSDGTFVPANAALTDEARQERWRVIHKPFHDAIASFIDRRVEAGGAARLVAVHSFTPRKRIFDGDRPWLLGLLHGPDARLAGALARALGAETAKAINLTFNAPYIVDHESDYTLPVHGERRGLPNILLEIRQDQIADAEGQGRWIDLLASAFLRITDDMLQRGRA
jgi:predicted N-formylglutamate amidohydrolase